MDPARVVPRPRSLPVTCQSHGGGARERARKIQECSMERKLNCDVLPLPDSARRPPAPGGKSGGGGGGGFEDHNQAYQSV